MSRERRLPDYIRDMRLAATDAVSFIGDMAFEVFEEDRKTQRVVVMCLTIIGEASARIAERHRSFVDSHPALPWNEMRGLRNRIVHGYSDINLELVYRTVVTSLPILLRQLDAIDLED